MPDAREPLKCLAIKDSSAPLSTINCLTSSIYRRSPGRCLFVALNWKYVLKSIFVRCLSKWAAIRPSMCILSRIWTSLRFYMIAYYESLEKSLNLNFSFCLKVPSSSVKVGCRFFVSSISFFWYKFTCLGSFNWLSFSADMWATSRTPLFYMAQLRCSASNQLFFVLLSPTSLRISERL